MDSLATYLQRAESAVRRRVAWNHLFRTASYLKSALWVVPFVAILMVLVLGPVIRWTDAWLGWRIAGWGLSGAQSLFSTVITLSLSFMVFTFGSLLVAIQVASGQLTPRIIATTLLCDNVVRYSVGLFVFTLVFSVMAQNRLETTVYEIVALLTALLGIACIVMFLFLIDYAARLLRPVSILARIGGDGMTVIRVMYPELATSAPDVQGVITVPPGKTRSVYHAGHSGILLAVDRSTLIKKAQHSNGLIECVPHVGDFVAADEPIATLYGGAVAIDDVTIQKAFAFGPERTMEQDPLFAFRILTDIALKALSPAINDPTTAVLALDQIHRLLRGVGRRRLHGEVLDDQRGEHRLIYRTPNWEDFVNISCNEIRAFGANSVQVARRLRALLDNLIATLPEHRHATLVAERSRLDETIKPLYRLDADLALARIADSQGLGASSGEVSEARLRRARNLA